MKTICLLFFLALTFFSTAQQAQKKEAEISNAEKFSERAGTLIQREFIDIGSVKKCKIQIAKYVDLINGQKTNAVRFEFEYKSTYGSSTDTKVALLDVDEIDGLLKSIKIIQDKILPTVASNYTEITFKSRSGFEAGCYSKKDTWVAYMKLEKFDSNSYIFMDKDELPTLTVVLEQAKTKL